MLGSCDHDNILRCFAVYPSVLKRLFDLVLCFLALPVFLIPLGLIALWVRVDSPGPALHWSKRIGAHGRVISLPKFRTMHVGTPQFATHLLERPADYITPSGRVLRRTSLDELPQLWSILRGDLSFVGPRPALFNQDDLIKLRKKFDIDLLRPGLTGLAQVNGRDSLSIEEKIAYDHQYLRNISFHLDLEIIIRTALIVFTQKNIAH